MRTFAFFNDFGEPEWLLLVLFGTLGAYPLDIAWVVTELEVTNHLLSVALVAHILYVCVDSGIHT
jgi:hypothetical protein